MKWKLLVVSATLVWLLGVNVRADETKPSVEINGEVVWSDDATAILIPDENWAGTGDFWAEITDAPTPHAECEISGPTYSWTLTPNNDGVDVSPDDEETTTVTIDREDNWGTSYTLDLKVTWEETATDEGADPRGTITADTSIEIIALKTNIEADLLDEPPDDAIYASGINPDSIVVNFNGVIVTPTITDIAGGKHVFYSPTYDELNIPGDNTVEITVRDNANAGHDEDEDINEVGNATDQDPFTWSFTLP